MGIVHGIRFVVCLAIGSMTFVANASSQQVGTPEQRAQLCEDLIQKTLSREAFSEIKNERLGLDVEKAMRACKKDFVDAANEHELLIALNKLSCTRRDRHLNLRPVSGGLRPAGKRPGFAPLQFATDYSEPRCCFVAAVSESDETKGVAVGDVVVGVNGASFQEWTQSVAPYLRSSTEDGLWGEFAVALGKQSGIWPTEFNKPTANYTLRKSDGTEYEVSCSWGARPSIGRTDDIQRDNFRSLLRLQTFDLYVHNEKEILLLDWHMFGPNLVKDMNRLMDLAEKKGWIEYDIVFDGTRSVGGSFGAYAIQRLFGKPFKTTFGNIRLSDAVPPLITMLKLQQARRSALRVDENMDINDGSWLLEWLEKDVEPALKRGDKYTENVPFKLAHLPRDSDGVIQPADVHFKGKVVCLFGPHGGSHLDQFASIVVDNKLAHTIGMPTGGYSNTWEWQEVVKLPGSDRPLVGFMWSVGQTIRPNGEVLEGNPAQVDDYIPITRKNFANYRDQLLRKALGHLQDK